MYPPSDREPICKILNESDLTPEEVSVALRLLIVEYISITEFYLFRSAAELESFKEAIRSKLVEYKFGIIFISLLFSI